jgi:hypothetical protein
MMWRSLLLVKETEVPRENLSQVTDFITSNTPLLGGIRTHNFSGYRH